MKSTLRLLMLTTLITAALGSLSSYILILTNPQFPWESHSISLIVGGICGIIVGSVSIALAGVFDYMLENK